MKKGILTTIVLILLCSVVSMAQWVNQGAWPDATVRGQMHGVAVDPAGKVWAGNFSPEKFLPPGGGATDSVTANLIRVFNPDGSPASFSPVWRVVGNGINDTLKGSNVRGMRRDNNGNILLTLGNRTMYRINYQTGAGMNKVPLPFTSGTQSPTAPAVSSTGQIFVGPVVNANDKILEFDTDFNLVGAAVTFPLSGFSRSMECSNDGNTLYFPSYDQDIIRIYQRPDDLSAFDSVGVILGFACESITFNKVTGKLWIAAGSYNDAPDTTKYTRNTWYSYDLATNTVTDSLKWTFNVPDNPGERPRALDFSPDGNTAYIGVFGAASDLVQKVVNQGSAVDPEGQVVVDGYKLSQNYPNPFNPTTRISFELKASGYTTLKVYDMLGNEVATLVQNELTEGPHSVNFNAANLASGTYVYQLNVNGTRITNKMVLLK